MYDIVIIGSGLSGLQCGALLSREGYNVCILDKNNRIGGMMQSFVFDGVVFNTGLNYTESLGEGEVLYKYFKLFNLTDKLTYKQLDVTQAELITIGDKEYKIPQGHQNYIDALVSYFPDQANAIKQYVEVIGAICNSFPLYRLEPGSINYNIESPYWSKSASSYISQLTSNPYLRALMGGINILYAGVEDVSALYTHALINYSFIKSSWRIKEGGSGIANVLANEIRSNGGKILRNAEVSGIRVDDGLIKYITLSNGETVFGQKVISTIHPKTFLGLIDNGAFKNVFRKRIMDQRDSTGMFSVYVRLKKNTIRYQNYNHHIFKSSNVWTTASANWPQNCLMYTQYNYKTGEYADSIVIITYMSFDEVARWSDTIVGNRGDDYIIFKQTKAEQLIDLAATKIPGLRSAIASYSASTPLTYRDYTGSYKGSAYGIIKNCIDPERSIITSRTRVKNLFFTGQNLNMHGILGVSISSFLTCTNFVGQQYLYKKLSRC
ncbi:MAG: NAD(P)/FAD-dependent oxidoreductase [Marinilabiliaceae bacterium]|nr:NAD(P)/FAD-dependent oxidoreductase [Marinilabiliaceae bacterium]